MNRLHEPVFMAGPKPMLTEFGIHQRLESCGHELIKVFSPNSIATYNGSEIKALEICDKYDLKS